MITLRPHFPSAIPDYALPPRKSVEKETPSEYHWVVTTAAVAGTVVGTIATGGLLGAVIGGTVLATGAVPLRRFLAAKEDSRFNEHNPSAASEMIWTGGTQLFFGAAFGGVGAAGNWLLAGGKGLVAKFAGTLVTDAANARPILQTVKAGAQEISRFMTAAKEVYKKRVSQVALRSAVGAYAAYDLVTDKNGNFDPKHPSIDTLSGFVAALYAGNGLYSASFGANLHGLDAAVPMSLASYKLFRWLAGEGLTDFEGYNYNELLMWRYVAEGGNVVGNIATYGRLYLRPDLRAGLAEQRGLIASKETGTTHVAPAAWLIDRTLGELYRLSPNILWYKNVIRPRITYEPGPPQWLEQRFPGLADRLTIIKGFKNNDIMKPLYGLAGRTLTIGYTWASNVPYWMFFAPAVGMSPGEWGPNRIIKFTLFPLIGRPMQDVFGGDTAAAQYAGFSVGLAIDYGASQFYNPRYKKKHWSKDLHQSLAAFRNAATVTEKNQIAEHVFDDIFCRQMTDLSWVQLRLGNGYYEFNPDYLAIFGDEISKMDTNQIESLKGIYQNRLSMLESGQLDGRQREGLTLLGPMLPWPVLLFGLNGR